MAQYKMNSLKTASTEELLTELCEREGTFRAVARAQLLVLKKSEDYNGTAHPGEARDAYFPFGTVSYAQMLFTKALRFVSLARKEGKDPNFEGLEDTALDIINYASFFIDWSTRQREG